MREPPSAPRIASEPPGRSRGGPDDGSTLPRPDRAASDVPRARPRRRRWRWIAALILVLNAGAVTYLVARPDGSGIPDRILGLDRSRSEDARSFEDLLADAHTGSLSLRGAMYGSDGRTELILERFLGADDPFQGIPIRLVLGQAAEGFGGALGGHAVLDTSSMVVQTRAGVDYACAPFRGAPSVSGVGDAGELCIFSGRVSGLLFDLRTSGTATALDDVEAAYNAVLDAS